MKGRDLVRSVAIAAFLAGCAGKPVEEPPPVPVPVAAAPGEPAPEPEEPWAPVLESEREWIGALKARLPSSWASYEADPHFVFLYDRKVKESRIRELAKEVVRHLRDAVAPRFPPAAPLDRLFLFRVCKDRNQYIQYGGPPDSAGYWSERDGECVLHEERMARKDVLQSLRSIAVLQYLHLAGAPGTHPWFRVGISTALSPRGVGGKGKPHSWWAARARRLARSGAFLPPAEFLGMGDDAFVSGNVQGHTAQAWALGWCLLRSRDPRLKGALERYYLAHRDRLAAEPRSGPADPPDRRWAPPEAVEAARAAGLEAAFGGLDGGGWKRLEREWQARR